ncbi:MAG: hypothetical protein IKX61_01060 [Prevotella sp.]|nr:hypothetical protein [Prevotella sp.]
MPLQLPNILMVLRAECFSPNAVEKDAAILHAVGDCLSHCGRKVSYMNEEQLSDHSVSRDDVGVVFSMARSEKALACLRHAEADGVLVINSTDSVHVCNSRHSVDELMRSNNIPTAPCYQGGAAWVKSDRGHQVSFAADEQAVMMLSEKMENPVITSHVPGESLKFYGVVGRFFYPSGHPALQQTAERLARLVDISVYGGDAILRPDGSFAIVDFNDWPSFSCCREKAAAAISDLVM